MMFAIASAMIAAVLNVVSSVALAKEEIVLAALLAASLISS
jgi:hypothetical protein